MPKSQSRKQQTSIPKIPLDAQFFPRPDGDMPNLPVVFLEEVDDFLLRDLSDDILAQTRRERPPSQCRELIPKPPRSALEASRWLRGWCGSVRYGPDVEDVARDTPQRRKERQRLERLASKGTPSALAELVAFDVEYLRTDFLIEAIRALQRQARTSHTAKERDEAVRILTSLGKALIPPLRGRRLSPFRNEEAIARTYHDLLCYYQYLKGGGKSVPVLLWHVDRQVYGSDGQGETSDTGASTIETLSAGTVSSEQYNHFKPLPPYLQAALFDVEYVEERVGRQRVWFFDTPQEDLTRLMLQGENPSTLALKRTAEFFALSSDYANRLIKRGKKILRTLEGEI